MSFPIVVNISKDNKQLIRSAPHYSIFGSVTILFSYLVSRPKIPTSCERSSTLFITVVLSLSESSDHLLQLDRKDSQVLLFRQNSVNPADRKHPAMNVSKSLSHLRTLRRESLTWKFDTYEQEKILGSLYGYLKMSGVVQCEVL